MTHCHRIIENASGHLVAKAVRWTNGQRRFSKSVGARYDGRVVPNLSGPGLCCKSFWVKRAAVRAGLWVTLASTGYYLTADPG